MTTLIRVEVPLMTVSGMNAREHYMKRHRRVKREREAVAWSLKGIVPPALPLVVTMTRVAPSNGLDDDNLASALKPTRDQIAAWLGIDDRSKLVRWVPAQRRGDWGVVIEIARGDGDA